MFRAMIGLVALVTFAPAGVFAQAAPAVIAAVGEKTKAGDTIFVTDRHGVQTAGRLVGLSPQALVLLVAGKPIAIPSDTIGRVEKRDSLWNGMLIGAAPGALLGMAVGGASCSPHCGRDVPEAGLIVGALGAGIGALVDRGVPGYAILAGPPLPSPNARDVPAPVSSPDELWLRVRQGDRIGVTTASGKKIDGTFLRTSAASVTLLRGRETLDIASNDIVSITRRGNRYRSAALWGGLVFGSLGVIESAACKGGTASCGNPLFVGAFSGMTGVVWGAFIGAMIPKSPVVFQRNSRATIRVTPELRSGGVAVAVSGSF